MRLRRKKEEFKEEPLVPHKTFKEQLIKNLDENIYTNQERTEALQEAKYVLGTVQISDIALRLLIEEGLKIQPQISSPMSLQLPYQMPGNVHGLGGHHR